MDSLLFCTHLASVSSSSCELRARSSVTVTVESKSRRGQKKLTEGRKVINMQINVEKSGSKGNLFNSLNREEI